MIRKDQYGTTLSRDEAADLALVGGGIRCAELAGERRPQMHEAKDVRAEPQATIAIFQRRVQRHALAVGNEGAKGHTLRRGPVRMMDFEPRARTDEDASIAGQQARHPSGGIRKRSNNG
ncbi:MAG: hypothetical protein ACK55I_22045, partial [bacterium]